MALEDRLEQLDHILGTVNAGYESHARMLAKAEMQETLFIKKLAEQLKTTEDQVRMQLRSLEAAKKREKYEEQREVAMANGIKQAVHGLQQFFSGSVSSTQALYNSDNAFTAVIPTLQLLGNTVKSITGAMSTFFSGLPFVGGAFTAADKMAGVVVDLGTQLLQAQLENAAKLVGSYNEISKTGMTFGANLEKLQKTALDSGMSIGTFSKFVTSNIDNLAAMGGALESNAAKIGNMSYRIAQNNGALLTIYGSYEALAGATADYTSMLSGYGIDVLKTTRNLEAGAKDYLVQQKELTSLTGKNAEALKREEEERRKNAAYQMRLGRMNEDQAANVRKNITMFGTVSKEAGDFATEVFNTQGNVSSKQALLFQQQFPELAETIRTTQADAERMNIAEFNKNQAEYIQSRAPLIKMEAERLEDLFKLAAGGVKNEYIDQANRTASGILAATTKLGNIVTFNLELEARRKELEAQAGKGIEKGSLASVIDGLEKFKRGMDAITTTTFPAIASITDNLIAINAKLAKELTGPASKFVVEKFSALLDKLLSEAGVEKKVTPIPIPQDIHALSAARIDAENQTAAAKERLAAVEKEHGQRSQEAREARLATRLAEAKERKAREAEKAVVKPEDIKSAAQPVPPGAIPWKSPESHAGGKTDPRLEAVLADVYAKFGEGSFVVTGADDKYHREHKPGSKHTQGLAADIKPKSASMTEIVEALHQRMREKGIQGTVEAHPDADGTGQHLHMQITKPEEKRAEVIPDNETNLAMVDKLDQAVDLLKRISMNTA